jgi:hypothetical protein
MHDISIRVGDAEVILYIAEFTNKHEMASRVARAKLTSGEAFALAAKLVQAGADLLEKELEAAG